MAHCKGCGSEYDPVAVDPKFWNIRDICCNDCHYAVFKSVQSQYNRMIHAAAIKMVLPWAVGATLGLLFFGVSLKNALISSCITLFIFYRYNVYKLRSAARQMP